MKNLICHKILAPALVFIILSCESPAGFDAGDSSEPAAPGYAVFPNAEKSSENNEGLFTPSISANSTLRSADWGTFQTAAATSMALTGAFISGSLWGINIINNGRQLQLMDYYYRFNEIGLELQRAYENAEQAGLNPDEVIVEGDTWIRTINDSIKAQIRLHDNNAVIEEGSISWAGEKLDEFARNALHEAVADAIKEIAKPQDETINKVKVAAAIGGAVAIASAALMIANIFLPEKANETEIKLNALMKELTAIQTSIKTLQTQIREDVLYIEDMITKVELGKFLTQITDAAAAAQFHGGNDMSLSKAGMTFMAVDGEITTGSLATLNNAENYADVCRALYSTGNPYIGIKENHKLYNAYLTLAHLILGSGRNWTDGLSACDAYAAYLSKVLNYNTQTFKKRQDFIDSMYNTYCVLTNYLLRAVLFDIDFNYGLYAANMAIVDAADTEDDLREEAKNIAGTAINNFLYDCDTLLDPKAEDIGSITYMNAQVNEALTKAQKALQKDEAIAKVLPITGEAINPDGVSTYTKTVAGDDGEYDPLIYSYRLRKYLKKELIEAPAEQYVRYNMGTDYQIADWEKDKFRDITSLESVLRNYKLTEADMTVLNKSAYYRGINIIDDLSGAEFNFNFSLKNSGSGEQNTFYILGMGGAWATSSSGYRKIFEKVIVWQVYAQGPRLDATWTPDGEGDIIFDRGIIWRVLAINYSGNKKSTTAYSAHGDAPSPDPCILVYGDQNTLPSGLHSNS